MDNDLAQILKDRGIYDVAVEFGWQQHTYARMRGWKYPLFWTNGDKLENIERWKRFGDGDKFKYAWIKPEDYKPAKYYILPGAFQAIKDSGEVIIASGEPDVLAFRAAGINNVMCWFGEKSIPDTLLKDLQFMGVERVIIYPDTDETGLRFTAGIHHMLQGTGIGLMPCRLPYEFKDNHGSDINQLWIDSQFNATDFNYSLIGCETLPLDYYSMYIPADMPEPSLFNDSDFELPTAFLQAIESALGVNGFKSNGYSRKNVSCPFHGEDKNPSASWHKDGSLNCFKCGSHNAKDTGAALNIHLRDYLPQRDYTQQPDYSNLPDAYEPLPPEITDNPLPPPQQPTAPESEYATPIHRSDYVMRRLGEKIRGEVTIRERSFTFPLESLHQFGGFMKTCDTCKITGIIGGSGDGKTQFLETITDILNMMYGVDGLFFGSEWTDEEMSIRRAQRWSSQATPLTYEMIKNHCSYIGYKQDGFTDEQNPMSPMTPEQIAEYDHVEAMINSWAGSIEYFGGSTTLEQTLDDMRVAIARERHDGKNILFIAFDYAQLLKAKSWDNSTNRYEYAVEMVKDFSIEQNVHVFMTSQVNKTASADSKEGGTLTADSANFIRKDKFNLMLILDRQFYKNKEGKWIETNAYFLNVGKASMGGKPEGYTDTIMRVPLMMHPNRLYFSETDWRKIHALPFTELFENEYCTRDKNLRF